MTIEKIKIVYWHSNNNKFNFIITNIWNKIGTQRVLRTGEIRIQQKATLLINTLQNENSFLYTRLFNSFIIYNSTIFSNGKNRNTSISTN